MTTPGARLHVAHLVHALIARLVREPLLQFLTLGGVLFALYSLVGERGTEETEKIVVSASRVANLRTDLRGRGGARRARRSCKG